MKVTNWYYIVIAQDTSGNDARHYHFYDEADACRFALTNKNIIAYGLPGVYKITYSYNPDIPKYPNYKEMVEKLNADEILFYETERKKNNETLD